MKKDTLNKKKQVVDIIDRNYIYNEDQIVIEQCYKISKKERDPVPRKGPSP